MHYKRVGIFIFLTLAEIMVPTSFMSAITLLGTPAEIYQYGTMYWLVVLAFFLVMPATNYLYMPIFYELQVTSAYEVCSRFSHNRTVR